MAWLQGSRLTHGCCMGRHRKWAAVRSYWSSIQSRSEIIFAARQGAPCTVRGTSAHSGHSSSIQEVHGYSGTFSAFIGHSIQEVHGSAHSSNVIGEFMVWCIHCALVYLHGSSCGLLIPSAHWNMFCPVVGTFICACRT